MAIMGMGMNQKDMLKSSQQHRKDTENKVIQRRIKIILCLLVCFVFCQIIQAYAQENNEQNKIEQDKEVKLKITLTSPYILGPGDQLSITDRTLRDLFGLVERYDVTVASDGHISVPLPDGTQQNILAAGLTLDDLATDIRDLFGKTLKNPLVFTQISRYRPINVYITGEIAKPGIYKVETTTTQGESGKTSTTAISTFGLTLTNAIQLAGGLKPQADITSITLINGLSAEKKVISLKSFFDPNIPMQDYNLQSGDTVYIPRTDIVENQVQSNVLVLGKLAYQEVPVSIVGEVKTAGSFVFSNDSTLLDALGKAGWANVVGTSKKIKLSRLNEKGIFSSQELDIDELLKRGVTFNQIALRPNDVIEVQSSKGKEVRHFFRDTGNIIISTIGGSFGSFIVQDNMFNRLSRKANSIGKFAGLNSGTSSVSVITAPGNN